MLRTLTTASERHGLKAPFRISRGVKTEIEVVVAEVRCGQSVGRGEAVPYPRYGESCSGVVEQITRAAGELGGAFTRRDLLERMAPGAARNAVDCALWDLEGQEQPGGTPRPVVTAITISLDEPEAMAAAAAGLAGMPLLKVKVDGQDPEAQIRAVRGAALRARLIVDPNESWSFDLLRDLQPLLRAARVDLLEQPLPAGDDAALEGFSPAVPICADESCHVAADLDQVAALYQAVNIKLDKTGGLTAALELYQQARARGLLVMVGSMVCTSLSIAPALVLAGAADFVDLDGPLWLTADHAGGAALQGGVLEPPAFSLWEPSAALRGLHSLRL
ncbi:MAG: dipeptide epimerase [Proteobacteria bacterium]|nr:dipeptide epimerase [Pseudomonadota bacterium]MBW3617937.1 dipeptide epimerase [Pseudomonadota bacterium]